MKTRFVLNLGLLAILSASCTPQAATAQPAQPNVSLAPSATSFAPAQPTLEAPTQAIAAPTEIIAPTGEPTALPIATSRGPNLEATDPATVSLASGGLQFVEFFRFT